MRLQFMTLSTDSKRFLLLLFGGILIQTCSSFLWYSPISKTQTLEDCLLMKETRSPFYPSYCDRLLRKYSFGVTTTPQPIEVRTLGWGWASWGPWLEDACPEVCGRRCRLRRRGCGGPFHVACQGKGRAFEFEDCPALEEDENFGDNVDPNEEVDTFQRTTERNRDFLKKREQQQQSNRIRRRRRRRKNKNGSNLE